MSGAATAGAAAAAGAGSSAASPTLRDEPSRSRPEKSREEASSSSSSERNSTIAPAGGLSGWIFAGDNFLGRFADEQRIERLKGCADLERALKACVVRRDETMKVSRGTVAAVGAPRGDAQREDPKGNKIARFFGWGARGGDAGGGKKNRGAGDDGFDSSSSGASPPPPAAEASEIPSCAKETHEAWACRGMALGCASDLAELKKCFRETEDEMAHYLSNRSSTYAAGGDDGAGGDERGGSNLACAEQQRKLGSCATLNAARLQERLRNRSQKER